MKKIDIQYLLYWIWRTKLIFFWDNTNIVLAVSKQCVLTVAAAGAASPSGEACALTLGVNTCNTSAFIIMWQHWTNTIILTYTKNILAKKTVFFLLFKDSQYIFLAGYEKYSSQMHKDEEVKVFGANTTTSHARGSNPRPVTHSGFSWIIAFDCLCC